MFRPVTLFISLRYTRAKKRNSFISFISLSSMLGIALGVLVLITVLSVMNGFDYQIKNRIFSLARQVTVSRFDQKIKYWQTLLPLIKKQPHVVAQAPFVAGQGMLTSDGVVQPAAIIGIVPNQEATVTKIKSKMVDGKLSALKPKSFGIVLGEKLAQNLGANIGDKVTLVTPEASVTPAGIIPRFKRFTVVGIFSIGRGFGFDGSWAFINLHDAQVLFKMGKAITGLRLKLDDLYRAPRVAQHLARQLKPGFTVSDWTLEYGSFFKAIAMEKTMMFVILLLIIAVAVFNLVSSLVMIVTDKQSDIAVLKTLGATNRDIISIFVFQGLLVGLIGTVLGIIGGVALAAHITSIVTAIQNIFHVTLFQSDAYYLNYLPSKLQWTDVTKISVIAILLSLLATLYPAWRAATVQPAEALRYE